MFEDPVVDITNNLYPLLGKEIKVRDSKAKGKVGNLTTLEVLAKTFVMIKELELGRVKQSKPLEEDKRRDEEDGKTGEIQRDKLRQLLWTVSNKGYCLGNCGCESKKNEEKGEEFGELEEEEGECLEIKGGENKRVLKCLQVDLSFKKVFNGRNESKYSNTSSGNLLHIFGSISLANTIFLFSILLTITQT